MTDLTVSIPQWCDCCLSDSEVPPVKALRFNPTMVRLLPFFLTCLAKDLRGFNPTMVRLLLFQKRAFLAFAYGFNPTMVRLLPLGTFSATSECLSFNPTMVRLLRNILRHPPLCLDLFQSHNGAIAAASQHNRGHQANMVSIPQWCDCCANGSL